MPSTTSSLVLSASILTLGLFAGACNRLADDGGEGFGDGQDPEELGEEPGGGGTISESCWDGEVQSGELCQVQGPDQPAGIDPCSLSVDDFDGDGRPDLAVPNSDWLLAPGSSHFTNVLRGFGDGKFAGTEAHDAGAELPVGLATGDFDGDGDVDIATANNDAGAAFIALNQLEQGGGMSFAAAVGEQVGGTASSLAAGDFDNDGVDDLVVTTPDGVALIRNSLGGGSQWIGTLEVGGTAMHADLVDMDLDGNLDLLVAVANDFGGDGKALIFHGAGDGSFPEKVEHAVGSSPWWIEAGDLNGDGHLDLAVADYGGSTVSLLLGNSEGGFSARTSLEVCWGPQSVAIGDMNSDGANDLVIGCMDSDTIELWVQVGGGDFELVRWWGTGSRPVSVQVADLNLDGVLDVAWANQYGNSVGMALSHP